MICRYCKKTIADDSIFCSYCGKSQITSKPTQTEVQKPAPQIERQHTDCLRFLYTAKRGYYSPSKEEIYPLVAISHYLVSNGFTFCRASTADGISEILHSGDAPYNVIYRSLYKFENRFVDDFFNCQKNERERSGGWISSLNYGHVDVYLKKGDLLFHASVGGKSKVEWYRYTEQDLAFIEQTDETMQQILAPCTCVDRQIQPNANIHLSYWD